ncbi:fumarylpyruvate hydrolase [Roseibium hamelinense]|uniref:Fumarylpyruvate hydrolase n=1 Tax=Roseibium hamelinense TaxID=150831 RepID=A0A562SZ96_9HYPH|nr:fumarylacetoacetate hydrolase family protein [Roseibium hamelinense]MTI43619.1 fumarylacetoacetate hydrolase family protein [Roseibium hamelinense]TWI86136.1 fumarylpyruvate hydrolase [Roseibium hamelinense]
MSPLAIDAPEPVTLPVFRSEASFPVNRVYCIGRNYAAHAVEMGHDPDREPPFFFQKNPDNVYCGQTFPYPAMSADVHHEIELAVLLKSGGSDISERDALEHVFGYAVALDMTRRDLQAEAKKSGRPWEVAKAFEHSAPISEILPISEIGHLQNGRISLSVNGELRQEGDLNQMIWKVPDMISYLSRYFSLAAGDVILTGTPSGVGPVQKGDKLDGHIDGLPDLSVTVI